MSNSNWEFNLDSLLNCSDTTNNYNLKIKYNWWKIINQKLNKHFTSMYAAWYSRLR